MPSRPVLTSPGSSRRVVRTRVRPPVSAARTDPAALAPRLTPRDRWLLHALYDHQVLTTTQISELLNTGRRSAARRLRSLYLLGVLDSFRPYLDRGSAPEHYILGPAGAIVLAAERAIDLRALGWHASDTGRIAHSPWLPHTVGRNDLMTRLAADHHTRPHRRLDLWAGEKICAALWSDHIRPDAYAHHTTALSDDTKRTVAFFLEYDTGTYALSRLAGKLTGYARLAASTHPATPTLLLIHTATARREAALRSRLEGSTGDAVPVATTHHGLARASDSPADAIWLPLHRRGGRRELVELPDVFPGLRSAPTAPGTWDPNPDPSRVGGSLPWPPASPLPPASGGRR